MEEPVIQKPQPKEEKKIPKTIVEDPPI